MASPSPHKTPAVPATGGGGPADAALDAALADLDPDLYEAPEWCVPVRADVRFFDWPKLAAAAQFDVITMDPPWTLAGAAPTRGVAIGYAQLSTRVIEELPIPTLQTNGILAVWTINRFYAKAMEMMEGWGYEIIDEVAWVKRTVNRKFAKGHGHFLQHAREVCIIGKKGTLPASIKAGTDSDVIFAERRGQSQKPTEIYEIMERLAPNGRYLEIFARLNNLRDGWVSIGNEL
jgi:mRNA (2'-O-methyladenosine-N6-)-methyltransferase